MFGVIASAGIGIFVTAKQILQKRDVFHIKECATLLPTSNDMVPNLAHNNIMALNFGCCRDSAIPCRTEGEGYKTTFCVCNKTYI